MRFAKVVSRPEQAPADEAIVPWFYRTLRNAAIDQFRRRGAAERAHDAFVRELERHEVPTGDMEAEICACVSRLASTLKPEYAEPLQVVEIAGTPVKAFAEQKGLSANNAGVRVFPRAGSAQEARDGVLRYVRGARVRELHVQEPVATRSAPRSALAPRMTGPHGRLTWEPYT